MCLYKGTENEISSPHSTGMLRCIKISMTGELKTWNAQIYFFRTSIILSVGKYIKSLITNINIKYTDVMGLGLT